MSEGKPSLFLQCVGLRNRRRGAKARRCSVQKTAGVCRGPKRAVFCSMCVGGIVCVSIPQAFPAFPNYERRDPVHRDFGSFFGSKERNLSEPFRLQGYFLEPALVQPESSIRNTPVWRLSEPEQDDARLTSSRRKYSECVTELTPSSRPIRNPLN